MKKLNLRKISIKTHQLLSFNRVFSKIQKSENIFWPGCSTISMGEEIVFNTYKLLKIKIPDLKLSTMCCGKPSLHIEDGKPFEKRKKIINEELKAAGVKRIYTLCPNCQHTLSENSNCEIISAWVILEQVIPEILYDSLKGRVLSLHDPCPVKEHLENTEATRKILNKLGIEILEFKNNKEKTICCGKKNMLMTLNPEQGKKLFELRAKEAPSKDIVTYCASCVDTFKSNGFQGTHILELLYNVRAKGSWKNRYNVVKKIKKD